MTRVEKVAIVIAVIVCVVVAVVVFVFAEPACVPLNTRSLDPHYAWAPTWVPERVCEDDCYYEPDGSFGCDTECHDHPTRGREMLCPIGKRGDR